MNDREYEILKRRLDLKEMELDIRRAELLFEMERDKRYQESHDAKRRNLSYEFNPKNLNS